MTAAALPSRLDPRPLGRPPSPKAVRALECRHGYASLMIAAGVNVKALSTFMGHANIGITLNQYGHLLPGAENEAADMLDAFLARQVGGSELEPTAPRTAPHPAQSRS